MNQNLLHRWDVTLEEAAEIQKRLKALVQKTNSFNPDNLKTVAGVDASYKEVGRAVVVVLSFPELKLLETASYTGKVNFPYVPGFLSFRETPLALKAFEQLKIRPDLLLVDGQGIAHPRRMGIATHLGLFLDMPSIGCAKSVLVGKYQEPGLVPGDSTPLLENKEQVGVALRTKPRTKPMIISVGHKIDLPTAVDFVMKCLKGYRLPEPTRLADKIAGESEPGTEQGTLF